MTEFNNAFNEYMEAFKALDIPDKRMEIINSVKEINAIIDNLAEKSKIYLGYLKSKETFTKNNTSIKRNNKRKQCEKREAKMTF